MQSNNNDIGRSKKHLNNTPVSSPSTSKQHVKRTTDNAMTLAVSYCMHTGTKIVIGNNFKNCPTARKHNLIASEHPIFALPSAVIYNIYSESTTPTEHYISMVAYLVKLRAITTRDCALAFEHDAIEVCKQRFREFLIMTLPLIHDKKKLAKLSIPTLVISEENCSSGDVLKNHLINCCNLIEADKLSEHSARVQREIANSSMHLDAIANLYSLADSEQSLNQQLQNYKLVESKKEASTSHSKQMAAWAMKQIKCNTDYSLETLGAIRHALFQSTDRYTEERFKYIIQLVKDGLTYEDHERSNSLLVIRMLEAKLENLLNISLAFGFVDVEFEDSFNEAAITQYKTRTKLVAKPDAKLVIANRKPTGESALDRLKNKFVPIATTTTKSIL
jgi:hypothetical protein